MKQCLTLRVFTFLHTLGKYQHVNHTNLLYASKYSNTHNSVSSYFKTLINFLFLLKLLLHLHHAELSKFSKKEIKQNYK